MAALRCRRRRPTDDVVAVADGDQVARAVGRADGQRRGDQARGRVVADAAVVAEHRGVAGAGVDAVRTVPPNTIWLPGPTVMVSLPPMPGSVVIAEVRMLAFGAAWRLDPVGQDLRRQGVADLAVVAEDDAVGAGHIDGVGTFATERHDVGRRADGDGVVAALAVGHGGDRGQHAGRGEDDAALVTEDHVGAQHLVDRRQRDAVGAVAARRR